MAPSSWLTSLRERFDLTADMAAPDVIRESVLAGLRFRGTNLWVLIFAIVVASVGLNVNSAAVIIGAMLISPLMGPIVAIGFGTATADLPLLQKGIKNLFVATLISIGTSALYFWLTPLKGAGSELLARTSPTAWDVLIALFGGLAGAVGLTRRAVTNVVPGVAIATALMPPLCTVGYGLGSGHYAYAAGALYLFFINSVYISLAAFLVVRFLNLPEPTFADAARKRQVHRITWTIALLTALPSVWFGYRLVHRAVFENNVRRFVDEQLTFPATYVVARQLNPAARTVNVLLAGKRLRASRLDSIRARLPDYRLADARLTIRQGMAAYDSADARALRASLLEDLQSRSAAALAAQDARLNQLQQLLTTAPAAPLPPAGALLREVRAEHPTVRRLGLSWLVQTADSTAPATRPDSLLVVRLTLTEPLPVTEQTRLTNWLGVRLAAARVQLLLETPPTSVPTAPKHQTPPRRPRASHR